MPKELGRPDMLALNGATESAVEATQYSSLRIALEAVFRQRRVFLAIFLAVVGLALAITLLKHRQFQSEMMFLVQASRTNVVISADRSSSVAPVQDVTEEQINSEMQLLQSEDVIGAVVDPQWTAEQKSADQIREHEAKIAAFAKRLKLESAHKANVIIATFRAGTPADAASALEQLSSAYLAKRKLISRPPGTSEFFAEETKRYKDVWDRANADLVKFQQANGLVSVPDQEEALTQQILTTENDLRAAQANSAETDQRVQEATRLVSQVPQRQATQQRLTPNQGAVEQLQAMLVTLQNRRTELLNRYQPTDRLVQEVDKQIGTTATALRRMNEGRLSEDTTDVNPAWQQLRTGQVQAIVEKKAIQSRIKSLQSDLANLHRQLDHIQPMFLRYNELQEQVEQARNNYETFSHKRDQSNIEDAMDERKLVNIAVAEYPTLNYSQIAPRPLLYMALGFVTALFLAGSAVYFAESVRSTIANVRELAVASRYSVLAVLPFDSGMSRLNADVRGAPIISASERSLAQAGGTLIPAMQNMQDAPEA
jgi:uncharacterized protein involved in exopolysaccharide biosynthesis